MEYLYLKKQTRDLNFQCNLGSPSFLFSPSPLRRWMYLSLCEKFQVPISSRYSLRSCRSSNLAICCGRILTSSLSRLYGANLTQAYVYWYHRNQDTKVVQHTVLAVVVLEAIHSIVALHATYQYTFPDPCCLLEAFSLLW